MNTDLLIFYFFFYRFIRLPFYPYKKKQNTHNTNKRNTNTNKRNTNTTTTTHNTTIHRYNNVHEILYNRSVVLKFGLRMKNSHLISSFSAWHHFAEERVHVRHTMIKYLNAIVRADEVQALQQWRKWSNWYERHAHEQDSHNLTTKIASLEDELHSCKTELEEFRAVFNRKRDKFVIALKARVESNRVGSSFKTWRYYAHQRHSARRTINRLCNKQLAASWHSWIAHDSALKEDLHIRSMANAERAKERERKKVILNRTLKHMKQLKLSKTFKSWKATIDEYVHERFILNRFVSRWKNQDLHHRFTRMITFTKDSLHQKKTARKVLNRIARTAEVAAWSKWVHAVTMLREHDKEAQESERKKAHDDLVLERFVRRWRSMDLHTRFTSWKETWRSSKHKRDTQSQLADLRAEYESKIGGLQAARDAEREMRIKKTVAAWLNNMLSHCFHRWSELASRNQRERNVVAKFVLQWQKSGLVSAYRSWKYKIRHLKRSRRIVKNMRLSKGRRTLAKLFKVWKEASAATAKDRRLLIRFGQRWRNMGLTKVWLSWHEFVDSRKHARSLVKKVLSRVLNQKISSGFRAWCSFSLKYEANKALEKLKSNALLEKHKAASAELEAKQNSAKRMLRHMMQRNLAHKFRTWSTNVTEICRVREVVRKIGIKMMKSGMVAAFAKWQEMIDDRNLARKVLRILLNAKLNSAFKTWFAYSHWISKWTAENAVAKVQELTIALNRIRKRSVKTLLWDRYKEIMGTAMHAWYLTIVQHREAEHLRFEEAEHTRLEAALSREAAEHQKYENALAKGHDQEEALANLNIGLEKAKYLTQQEHLKFERAKKHDEEEHKRLEEALAREAAEHQKYEHAVEQGHDKDVALKNLEKGLEKAKQIAEDEHLKNIEEHKLLEKANDALAHKPKLARALISSVWHKHKSQLRSKEKGKHARSERKTQGGPGNMSALAIAKAGFRGIKGRTQGRVSPTVSTSRTSSPIPGQTATLFSVVASAEGNKKMTGGRMVQKTLEELNDLVHTFTTATDVEAQCLLLRDIAGRMVRADNVDMFVKDETSFWTMVPKERTLREKEEGVDVHKVCKKQSWPLNAKGGMVASSLLQGHIIDSENALMDNMYSASPDLSPEGGKRRDVTTLAVLVVPLMDKHGKTMGAIRASRGVSSRGAEDSFSSIDSLLLCILAAMVQCTWNFSGATHDALVLRSLTPTSNEKEEKNFTPIETNKQDEKRPAEEEGWQQILRDAIVEFDRSHAGVVSRLNGTRRRSPPPEIIQPIVSRIPHTAAPFSSAFRSTRDRSTRNAHTTGMFGNNAAGNGNFEQKIQSSYVSPMSMRSSTLGMNDLSNVYSPSLRPYGETNRGVVSFVHHNYHEEY